MTKQWYLSSNERFDWDKVFKHAEERKYPFNSNASICISNRNPDSNSDTARNVFKDDKKEILTAAKAHGFVCLSDLSKNPRAVSFVKRPNKEYKLLELMRLRTLRDNQTDPTLFNTYNIVIEQLKLEE